MQVLKKEGKWEIRIGSDGRLYCTCPAWRFQRVRVEERRPCKHIMAYAKS